MSETVTVEMEKIDAELLRILLRITTSDPLASERVSAASGRVLDTIEKVLADEAGCVEVDVEKGVTLRLSILEAGVLLGILQQVQIQVLHKTMDLNSEELRAKLNIANVSSVLIQDIEKQVERITSCDLPLS